MPVSNGSLESENCSDITDWTDIDTGGGASTQATFDGQECFSFAVTATYPPRDAGRTKDVGSVDGLGNRYVVSIKLYCDAIGTLANVDYFELSVERSDGVLSVRFCSDGLFIANAWDSYNEVGVNLVVQDTWQEWTFDVDISGGAASAVCDVYLDNVLKASDVDCSITGTTQDGYCLLRQRADTTTNLFSYIDWFKVGDAFGGINIKVNIGDVFKDALEAKINIGGVWKTVSGVQINIGDVWKTVF